MQYIFDYDLCALVLISIIAIHFFSNRQFPNMQNRIFGVALVAAFFDVLLDLIGAFTIPLAAAIPPWINYLINTVFYSLQLSFVVIVFVYAMIITKVYRKDRAFVTLIILPVLLLFILLIVNLFLPIIFTVDAVNGYVHLPAFMLLYIVSFLYMLATLILVIVKRDNLTRGEWLSMVICLCLCFTAALYQFFDARYLLIGMSIAVFMLMMYLVTQRPGNMLDIASQMFNRNAMTYFMRDAIAEHRAYSLLHVRIDNLGRIDAMIGYHAGDRIVRDLGEYFNHLISYGWGFRMGGSQFLLVCRNRADYERNFTAVTRRFDEPWIIKEAGVSLSATICGVPDTRRIESVEEMLELMETIVREQPAGSRTTVDLSMIDSLKRQAWIEDALSESLKTGEGFEIHYQPIRDAKTGRYTMAEALLRFKYRGQSISPGEFIPIAERSGQILKVDEMVMRKVCSFLRNADLREKYGLASVEINLSAIEFLYDRMPERIEGILREYRIPTDCIVFEITETAATADYDTLKSSMQSLCAAGYSFALDDFGTGYANLTQVVRLPFRIAKLDRSMLTAIRTHHTGNVIYRNVINMFNQLGLSTVAEGIETTEQEQEIRDLKVDYLQGYHFAMPMCEKDFIAFLSEHRE